MVLSCLRALLLEDAFSGAFWAFLAASEPFLLPSSQHHAVLLYPLFPRLLWRWSHFSWLVRMSPVTPHLAFNLLG